MVQGGFFLLIRMFVYVDLKALRPFLFLYINRNNSRSLIIINGHFSAQDQVRNILFQGNDVKMLPGLLTDICLKYI